MTRQTTAQVAIYEHEPTESEIQTAILHRFATVEWCRLWRVNSGQFLTPDGKRYVKAVQFRGHSDLCGILPGGRFWAIEVKNATGRVTPEQRAFLDMVNAQGGLGFVARSVADVEAMLRGTGYGEWL